MIYQAILKIKGKEIPLLYYSYRCHLRHCDDPNLGRIIQLHIQVCEEIGNRENLPVEGDLITLMFECSGDEQFFYDWLNEGSMHYGEIHFIYNENEVVDIFRFWDCFCLKIEESMSAVNSPMVMTVYLSPGIIKRNNLEVREKVWKISDIMQKQSISPIMQIKDKGITEVYWTYSKDFIRLKKKSRHYIDLNLHIKTHGYMPGECIAISIKRNDLTSIAIETNQIQIIGRVNNNNEVIIENVFEKYTLNLR